ncbi:hypothetical protein ACIBL3_44660 [Kribbella sp. NPDC050124]|uniref:hypothetical protein n=1 Tax=Kribbella sp. NPDC050124 TaxID=3364114 RepID=UPI003799AD00
MTTGNQSRPPGGLVEVVRQHVERDMPYHLRDPLVGNPGRPGEIRNAVDLPQLGRQTLGPVIELGFEAVDVDVS